MTEQRRDERAIDHAVDAAWRRASGEQPPPEVDAAILAAARAAARRDAPMREPAKQRRRWTSWQPLAAAAGVIGLSFLLVQMLPRDDFRRAPAAGDAPPAPAAEPAPAREQPTPSARDASPAAAAPGPASGEAAPITSAERGVAAAPPPPPAMEAAAKQSVAPSAAPAAWAERIAALHEAGDLEAAAAELRDFRAAYPDADAYLPEVMHRWAATISRDTAP